MPGMSRAVIRRALALAAMMTLGIAIAAAALAGSNKDVDHHGPHPRYIESGYRSIPRNALKLVVGPPAHVHPIASGFLGLSIEYPSIESYAGSDPRQVNPVLVQLIRSLTPKQRPVIRIGGDSTDWMWWPVPHMRKPSGVRFALTPRWIDVTGALTRQLNARLILGLDLEVNDLTVEEAEARALSTGIGRQYIDALEPGNEPELYGSWAWYVKHGNRVYGRLPGWNIGAYEQELSTLRRSLHGPPLAGPATGGPKWTAELPQFLGAARYLKLVTLHSYPLQLCYTPASAPEYPTLANLLSPRASRGLAAGIAPYVRLAHAHGKPVRIGEMNTNSCGSAPSVTKSFASALWAIDALFAMANAGVDGVNIHTYNNSSYELFAFTHRNGSWRAHIEPEYYGVLFFARAAPPGSKLLRLYGRSTSGIRAWATRGADGHARVTLINTDIGHARTIAIRIPGKPSTATLIRLRARGAAARRGVTIAGQHLSAAGLPAGQEKLYAVAPTGGYYVVKLPPASAALLTR